MSASLSQRLRAWAEKDGRGYPDWAVRYLPIARRLRTRNPGLVLEVGANQNGLARFWRGRVIAVDLEWEQLKQARDAQGVPVVQANIAHLPFASKSMPCWTAVEVLEHVPRHLRGAALQELARILAPDGLGVITFPTGPRALAAEDAIRKEYARFTGNQLRWLEEHDAEGLPVAADVQRELEVASLRVTAAKNANLTVWRWMWRVLLCGWPGRGNAMAQAALRILVPVISRAHWGACYRAILWTEPETKR